MAVEKKYDMNAPSGEGNGQFNKIHKSTNVFFSILFLILGLICIIPMIFVVSISFTNEDALLQEGYKFIPSVFSTSAYSYIFKDGGNLINSYVISFLVTIVGTALSLAFMSTYAYVLSRKTYKYRKIFLWTLIIPMFFQGGLVPSYLVMTQFLHLRDSFWALVLPLLVNSFNVIILRTFFKTSVPDSIVESAKIDGASQLKAFIRIVLPISLPGLATVGLFMAIAYWNDWFQAMLYINDIKRQPLQGLLMQMERNIEFIMKAKLMGATGLQLELPKESAKMAIVVLATLPIACAYPFFQKYFISGLTVGAVKE